MEFSIWRSSTFDKPDEKPCDTAEPTSEHGHNRWKVRIADLEGLVDFARTHGKIVLGEDGVLCIHDDFMD